jgi:hypothetical protein
LDLIKKRLIKPKSNFLKKYYQIRKAFLGIFKINLKKYFLNKIHLKFLIFYR